MARDDVVEALLAAAESQDCTVRRTKRGHWQVRTPSGAVLVHSGTSGDWRAVRNFRARLRKAGVRVP